MSAEARAPEDREPEMVAAARRVCEQGEQAGVDVRLLGGIAIWLRSPEPIRQLLGRSYADIDLATFRKQSKPLRNLLERLGYVPDEMFNKLQGNARLLYHSPDGSYHVDVFLEKFEMSHELDLGPQLRTEPITLPAAELLLTKLQIAELNRKDASDTAMLLAGHDLAERDGDGLMNTARVCELCASDWGLYTTVTDNLQTMQTLLDELVADAAVRETVGQRAQALVADLENAPKSGGWRRRAKLGRRKRWYQTPDEV